MVDKKGRKRAASIFNKKTQAEYFDKIQPIFYDSKQIWWLWNDSKKYWEKVDDVDILNMIVDTIGTDVITSKNRTETINALKQEGRRHIPKEPKRTWIQFKDTIIDVMTGDEFKATP